MICTRQVIRILIANFAIAAVVPILFLVLGEKIPPARVWEIFRYSFVYANTIGGLASFTMPALWRAVLKYPGWLRFLLRVGALFAAAVIGSLIADLILVTLGWLPSRYYWTEFAGSLQIATVITLLAGGAIGLYETMRARLDQTTLELRTKELERERALKLATEAQLASLESRIHPHFLFNALNSISSLIPEDPKRAERLVEQMAALLRFSLDSNRGGLVPLEREIKIVNDYLEIERARFGDRLRYRVDLAADLNGATVPPLSVQTLVENSVKYAITPNRAGGEIAIRGERQNGNLRLEVSDEGPDFSLEAAPAGHGIDNLRGRLASLFGDRAALTLERRGDRNNIILTLPESTHANPSISG